MKKVLIFFLFLFICLSALPQGKFTISGYVRDSRTGEELIGAIISVQELPSIGITTNSYGFYSLTIPAGSYNVKAQFVGYESVVQSIKLEKSVTSNFSLGEKVTELN